MNRLFLLNLYTLVTFAFANEAFGNNVPTCNLRPELLAEIQNYKPITDRIIQEAISGSFKGRVYQELAKFTDTFGPRWAGSNSLELSIDYMAAKMRSDGLQNIRTEPVLPPYKWTRGKESAELLAPLRKKLNILGQVPSVSSPPEGIEAEVIVFKDLDELEARRAKVPGKIVLFDYVWTTYQDALPYRRTASSMAAKHGAVATLVRSTATFSINSPHTSGVEYDQNYPKLPTASLTIEDSALLRRLQENGKTIRLNLTIQNTLEDGALTRNLMGDLLGHTSPEQLVILAGHIDSLDVGMGALDDGSGVFMATEALNLLNSMNLVPRRTIRSVLFTAEEMGLVGASEYVQRHKDELNNTLIAFEADQGAFAPKGLDFAGSEEAACIVQEILQQLLKPLNSTQFVWYNQTTAVSSDIYMLQLEGVPGVGANTVGKDDYYFWFHHSEGDTMNVLKTEELDANLAVWAVMSFVVADLSVAIPREVQAVQSA